MSPNPFPFEDLNAPPASLDDVRRLSTPYVFRVDSEPEPTIPTCGVAWLLTAANAGFAAFVALILRRLMGRIR